MQTTSGQPHLLRRFLCDFSIIVVIVAFLFLALSIFVKDRNTGWADGKVFIKEFVGNVESVYGNITISDLAGHVWFNGPLPSNHKIVITNVPHGTVFMIEWKDWRGEMSERWTVLCEGNESYLRNNIPERPPKSALPHARSISACLSAEQHGTVNLWLLHLLPHVESGTF